MISQAEFEAIRERVHARIDENADYFNLVLTIKLLVFARKYRIIKYEENFDASKFNASKTSLEAAILCIIGVNVVNVIITDWKITAHVVIEDGYFHNFFFNHEFHSDIQKMLRLIVPAEFTISVLLYPTAFRQQQNK